MNHVEVPKHFTNAVSKVDLNGDDIGFVESYDFSRANMSQESRIAAITTIASVCYQNPKALGSTSLYDRLATENKGLPSSSYEFVPILIEKNKAFEVLGDLSHTDVAHIVKYGEEVEDNAYLLTNLRAVMHDFGNRADQFFNTEEECAIIAKYFKVYKSKIDLSTARQFMRHRCSWQELSRRYVSGQRSAFEFYISPKLREFTLDCGFTVKANIKNSLDLYDAAITNGIKPEEARRVLPQAMYTTVWSAWQPKQLEVFYKLRLDSHAQAEIRELAKGMEELNK